MEISELRGRENRFITYITPWGEKRTDYLISHTIYSLINLDNGKRYIGRTCDPRSRIKSHLYQIRTNRHQNKMIRAESNCRFDFEILEDHLTCVEAREKEREYMIRFQTYKEEYGYNCNDNLVWDFIHAEKQ